MPAGRPSTYSDEVAGEICNRLIHGETLYKICQDDGMPGYRTVFDWLDAHADFRTRCARARELQAEYMDFKVLETAENCRSKEDSFSARVKIAAYQWRAMKLAPKKFGDRLDQYIKQETTLRTVSDKPEDTKEARESWIADHGNVPASTNGKGNGHG
jgi:hypothetical protein